MVKIKDLDGLTTAAAASVSTAETELKSAQTGLDTAEHVLKETTSVSWLTRRWRGLPDPDRQHEEVSRRREARDAAQAKHGTASQRLVVLEEKRDKFVAEVEAFVRKHSASPEEVLAKAAEHARRIEELTLHINQLLHESAGRRESIEETLARRLAVLQDWGLPIVAATDVVSMLEALCQAHGMAKLQVTGLDLSSITRQRDDLNSSILALDAELHGIEESLKQVEELVIADAVVVATTLTRAYLRDSIQSRRFDTVILDEASMAPIPAIWVAASVATANAIVVGDFRQLPPIVISRDDLAAKWLGRDVFTVAELDKPEDMTGRRVDLLVQHRMHPRISMIPNTLVYDGRLMDADGMDCQGEDELAEWYRFDWGHDHPVILVDTGSVGAWVTSVSRGSRASRLNFLSATICVDIAERLLRKDRLERSDGDRHRILIACPYRPHAKFLKLLVEDEGLNTDILTGTAHTFQGSEADVVILDLVNDEPHIRVGMFDARRNDQVKRLMNVALTRAKRRLVVIGDFDYTQKTANKEAFLRRDFLPFLLSHYPRLDARDVVPAGLAARAARAQDKLTGGPLEADKDRLVVTQERFYPVLQNDLAKAQQRIVIYSAFITQDRLGQLASQLRAAVERGVRVYVVTKARTDRTRAELANYQRLEKTLAEWGITVVHKRRMHEKLVFVDGEVIWVGSLNPLSFSNTQEIMERRHSKKVASDYAQAVLLDELLAAYGEGCPTCPICGDEVVASEGAEDPFYWTCLQKDCYSRSVNQPPLTDGLIVCTNCGEPVDFGEWGDNPVWRCTVNPRHRQRIARTHLRLPKMRALVPKRKLKRLEETLGRSGVKGTQEEDDEGQPTLFDP